MASRAVKEKRQRVQRARLSAERARILSSARRKFEEARGRDGSRFAGVATGNGRYTSATETRGLYDWTPEIGSADMDTMPDREALVARSRDLDRNNPYARAIVHTLKREVIGRGIWPRPARSGRALGWKPKRVRNYARNVLSIWERWAPHAGVRGDSIYALQKLVQMAMTRDGEVFVQFVGLPETAHRPYRLAVDIIESHRVSTPTDRQISDRRHIRDGIELDRSNMPIAVWVEVEDIEEAFYFDRRLRTRAGRSRWRRIPMIDDATGLANIVHVRDPERTSTRSVPLLAGALDQVQVLGEFVEAELYAKQAEGCIAAAITQTGGEGLAGSTTDDGQFGLEPGMIARLLPGESISFLDPKRPGGSFGPFVEFMLRSIAFSAGIPYEVAFIAFAGMNYSNARTTLLAAQRFFADQQDVQIERFLRPAYCRLLWEAWQVGDLKVAQWPKLAPQLCTVGFLGEGWKWVDPEKEAKANVLLLDNKLTSRSMALAPHGVDFEDIVGDLVYEEEVLEDAGLKSQAPAPGAPGAPESAPEQDADEESEEGENEEQGTGEEDA